jgi:hypothetical protein
MFPTLFHIEPLYTQRFPVASSITPSPVDAVGNAVFRVCCGSPGGATLTSTTDPIIVTEVPSLPLGPVVP